MIINPSRQLIYNDVFCPNIKCGEGVTNEQSVELNSNLREDGDFAYVECNSCNTKYILQLDLVACYEIIPLEEEK